jgi:hypothetical protein
MLDEYYSHPDVRARLCEFLGASSLEESPCVFITGDDRSADVQHAPRPTTDLWKCLDAEMDVGRSLWDRRSLIGHLDIEYVNFDQLGEAYLEADRVFEIQAPVVDAASARLASYGIQPLHLMSGRGHHLIWRIDRSSEAFRRLAQLGRTAPSTRARNAQPQPPNGEMVGEELGNAFTALGQVMEFVAHGTLDRASTLCAVPIQLTAVEVGPGPHGRAIVSIDISEYGDPLFTRNIRMPFSAYLKPFQQRWALGDELVNRLPPLFMIPLAGMPASRAIAVMRDSRRVCQLAGNCSVAIPDMSDASLSLVNDFARSDLARFHDDFYACEHDPPASWRYTYDRTPLEALPPCVRAILQTPNDRLAKPACIQMVVRTLMAVGWHPRHIAGLIRSKYERDHGWGDTWYRYDASCRADFYVRVFAGLLRTGRDSLIDFNCVSTKEKGYCGVETCNESLFKFRNSLLTQYCHA